MMVERTMTEISRYGPDAACNPWDLARASYAHGLAVAAQAIRNGATAPGLSADAVKAMRIAYETIEEACALELAQLSGAS